MAATRDNQKTAMQLRLEVGTTAGGGTQYSTRTISDVNPSVSDDDFLNVGTALVGLQNYNLGSLMRRDIVTIFDE